MGQAKQQRIAEARLATQMKRAKQTNALSIAALRAASARAVMLDELTAQEASGEAFLEQHGRAMTSLEVNPASRVSAMMPLFYASLNVVVEGWLDPHQAEPKLTDPRIDVLLQSEHPEALRKYRHAMMHPNPLDDRRTAEFAAVHSNLSKWAAELSEEFLRFFRAWRGSLAPNSAEAT
jgi:hypothetical protein